MAVPFLNYTERSLNLEKFKKNPKNSNLKSFWAFLLSTFIYIFVFYVFNLSPSTLLCTTKFWFVISNTLILIIAADFGSFSSSKEHDFFDEFGKNNVRAKSVPCIEIKYVRIDEKTMPKYHGEAVDEEPQEKIIGMVAADQSKIQETAENKPKIFIIHEKDDHVAEKMNEKFKKKNPEIENRARKMKKREAKILMAVAPGKKKKMVLQRTLSERHEEPKLEENEFSTMSDEELNRRVEDFIRRCNRQIRLQAVSNRQQG